jgi:hypothetical protein
MAWVYSDWITSTYPPGAARLAQLRLHIKEVSDALEKEKSVDGQNFSTRQYGAYLELLLKLEKDEQARADAISGESTSKTAGFTRGKALL